MVPSDGVVALPELDLQAELNNFEALDRDVLPLGDERCKAVTSS